MQPISYHEAHKEGENMTILARYENTEYGVEAIIAEGNDMHSHRVIMRDTDADEVVAVAFGTLAQCIARAQRFVE